MRINGIPSKFEVFQDYYYEVNGQMISYTDACNLYGKMADDERAKFEQYYKDETGYEIIVPCSPKKEPDVGSPVDTGKTKKVKKKKKGSDGKITYEEKEIKVYRFDKTIVTGTTTAPETGKTTETTKTIEDYTAQSVKNDLNVKYTLEAYAKENGMVIDPEWAVYSAEEIIQMENQGVNIPQDVLDIAHSIYESSSANLEGNEDTEDGEETTEKEPFLDLIPKAEKKIKKCEENTDKIEDKVEELLPEQNKRKSKLENTLKNQQASLKEFEDFVREWRHLQDKVNNGEVLTDREAVRYAELTGMLNNPLSGNSNFEIDKRQIAKSLNEINILAVLGEDLADETIEIADTLSDYTSKSNYKTTAKQVAGAIGPLAMILTMIKGKYIADIATQVGNDTKEYTEESHKSVLEIANIMDIESSIANTSAVQESETSQAQQNQAETVTEQTEPTNIGSEEDVQPDATGEGSTEGSTEVANIEEDFILDNDSVKELIGESADINIDLLKQTFRSVKSIVKAEDDKKFAKQTEKKIDKLIAEFEQEEEKRQEEVKANKEENKRAGEELEELTGKSSEELDEEETNGKTEDKKSEDESDKQKVKELRTKVSENNKENKDINVESDDAKAQFASATVKEKEILSKSIPEQTEALETDTEYKEEIIPEDKKVLNLTEASGMTLAKIGAFQTELGIMQMMAYLYTLGMINITQGAIKMGIGFTAVTTSDTPIPAVAEKATKKAVKEEDKALTALTNVDEKIAEQTGEESISAGLAQQEGATEGAENGENPEQPGATDGTADGATGDATATVNSAVDANVAASVNDLAQNTGVDEGNNGQSDTLTGSKTSSEQANNQNVTQNSISLSEQDKIIENVEENTDKNTDTNSTSTLSGKKSKSGSSLDADNINSGNAMSSGKTALKDAGKSNGEIKKIDSAVKDGDKESQKLKKDTEKDAKQLDKEGKKIQKEMNKDAKKIQKMNKESKNAAQKQQELLAEFETLVAENETMIAEDQQRQQSQANQPQPVQQGSQNGQAGFIAQNAFMAGAAQMSGGNADKIAQNDERLNELGISFSMYGRVIERNRKQVTKLQTKTKKNEKRLSKKCKLRDKKLKEDQKKELAKQKQLQMTLAIVGIIDNVFTIVGIVGNVIQIVGTIMQAIPYTAAAAPAVISAGETVSKVGQYGNAACALTKGIINLANGNLAAGLISIGQAVLTAVTTATGGASCSTNVFSMAAQVFSTVQVGADLANNIRAVQGKEASGTANKISAIAGAGAAVSNIASGFSKSLKADSATGTAKVVNSSFSQASSAGKVAQIAQAAGSVLSSTSQVMSAFGKNDKTTEIMGMVGAGISSISSVANAVNSQMNNAKNKNQDNQNNINNNSDSEGSDKTDGKGGVNSKDGKGGNDKGTDKSKGVESDKGGDSKKGGVDGDKGGDDKGDTSTTDDKKGDPLALTLNTTAGLPANPQTQADAQTQVDQQVTQIAQQEAANATQMSDLQAQTQDNQQQTQQLGESADTSDMPLELKTQVTDADLLSPEAAAAAINESGKQFAAANAAKQAAQQAKKDLVKQVLQGVGSLVQTIIPMVMSQNGQANTGSKKPVPPGKLTERTQQIIAKNRKRIQALTVMAMKRSQRQYA